MGQQEPPLWRRIGQNIRHGFKKAKPPSNIGTTPEHCYIGNVPREIFDLIFNRLSLPSQACLVLACKSLFHLYGSVLKKREFVFPRLLSLHNVEYCFHDVDDPRKEFLVGLENERWAYCSKCMRLHSRTEFSRLQLAMTGRRRACSSNAGIVDLCPCFSLTFRDLLRLGEYFEHVVSSGYTDKDEKIPKRTKLGSWHHCKLKLVSMSNDRISLKHQCHSGFVTLSLFYPRQGFKRTLRCPKVTVTLRDMVTIERQDEEGNCSPLYWCPHHGAAFRMPGDHHWFPPKRCRRCGTRGSYATRGFGTQIAVTTIRDLGLASWPPGKQWRRQCRSSRRRDYYLP